MVGRRHSIVVVMMLAGPLFGFDQPKTATKPPMATPKERFLALAPTKWKEYESAAVMLQGSWSGETTTTLTGQRQQVIVQYKHSAFGKAIIVTATTRAPAADFNEEVYCVNPLYAFQLRRKSPSSQWALLDLINLQTDEIPASYSMRFKSCESGITHPVRMGSELLRELLAKPSFKVTQCREVGWRGERLVEVAFEYPHADDKKPHKTWLQAGKMVLDPDRYWCLRSYEGSITTGELAGTEKGEIPELATLATSIPVPRKSLWERKALVASRFENTITHELEFDLQVPTPPPPNRDFTLTAYGLPEPPGFGWKPPTPWYLWVIGAALICLTCGALILWLRRRAATRAAAA